MRAGGKQRSKRLFTKHSSRLDSGHLAAARHSCHPTPRARKPRRRERTPGPAPPLPHADLAPWAVLSTTAGAVLTMGVAPLTISCAYFQGPEWKPQHQTCPLQGCGSLWMTGLLQTAAWGLRSWTSGGCPDGPGGLSWTRQNVPMESADPRSGSCARRALASPRPLHHPLHLHL